MTPCETCGNVVIPKGEYEMLKHLAEKHHPDNDYIIRLAKRLADHVRREERYGEIVEEICHALKRMEK